MFIRRSLAGGLTDEEAYRNTVLEAVDLRWGIVIASSTMLLDVNSG